MQADPAPVKPRPVDLPARGPNNAQPLFQRPKLRLTRLRLNGFKSFVDPTDLVIHEGLTGVVGPNGCGKSNLLEALRWVMGENRASAMRGAGMDDVIFNGAASRPARHFAEVALTIDNTERLAPAGFNDADQIEIIRRITREAGSAYKANSKEVRARDVQMLFADASTGSHSPALVRQGQITELINAKPKARRMILEEAAGISGLYQRRHEAELRLNAAEVNLTRVDDVLEGLAQQLSLLTRQAKQAARYREIGEELRRAEGMLLYLRWREAEIARAEADSVLRQRLSLAAQAEVAARAASKAREGAEDALPPRREEEAVAAAILQRLTLQRAAIDADEARARQSVETLKGRIAQLSSDMDREAGLNRDAGETIGRLDWEIAQLIKAAEGHDDKLDAAAEAAREAAAALGHREGTLSQATEDAARLGARHQSTQRLLADCRTTIDKAEAEASRATAAAGAAEAALTAAATGFAAAEAAQGAAVTLAAEAEDALRLAEEARAVTQAREAEARAARSSAEGEANAIRAEVAALAKLVAREAQAGTQLLDKLSVEPGFEAALGAALTDDLRAPEIAGAARSGWVELAQYDAPQPLPAGAASLATHVGAPAVLDRRLAQTGLVDAADGARLQALLLPGQRLVSLEGDLWRWDGYRAGADDAPSAAALRLRQLNRLVQLKRDLEDVAARASGAAQAHDALQARLADLSRADQMAREARRAADGRVTEANRAAARAEADRSIAQGKLEAARLALARHADDAMGARARLAEAEASLRDLGDLDGARAAVEAAKVTVEGARIAMMSARANHDELRREGEARLRRKQEATKELSGWRHRLDTAEKRSQELQTRRAEAEAELATASALPGELAAKRAEVTDAIETAETRRRAAADALTTAEVALRQAQENERDAERLAGEAREARARAEARAEAARDAARLAAERIAEEAEATPDQLLDTLKLDPERLPAADLLDTEVARLKRQRDALGAVNLRAEEDAKTVEAEYDALLAEKLDLEEAIKKLRSGIAGLNREGRERLLTAFEQVNTNFANLFTHLFGGGEARLVLVESDDPLGSGARDHVPAAGQAVVDPFAAVRWRADADGTGADLWRLPGQPRADLRAGRGGRAAGRRQRDAVLRPYGRDDPPHRNAVPGHHPPRRDDGADGPALWGHDGRARGQPAGFGRSEESGGAGGVRWRKSSRP